MRDIFNIIDKETLELIETKKAKQEKTIKEHIEELLERLDLLLELGYVDKDIYPLVEKACLYHDLGKLNDEFQKRVSANKHRKFDSNKEVIHNILSLFFIDKENFNNYDEYYQVAHSVLNHHNYGNVFEKLNSQSELISELLKEFKTVEFSARAKSKLAKEELINNPTSIKIKGLLHKCDYSASSGLVIEYENNFLDDSLNRLMENWKKHNPNSNWNELQLFCKENTNENIIAIAETGMGKTEAGLLWIGDTKGFFVLPIRTAINAIYDRVKYGLLNSENINERVAILHSSSLEYYLKSIPDNIDEKEEKELLNYHNDGKKLSIPLNISTMDQLFDFIFKYQGYELKLATLSYSKIVIDEIQAYGPELLAYLILGIENIILLGGKVAILTATLPPFIRDLLKKNIYFKENNKPFITECIRHNLKVLKTRINSEDIEEKYIENKDLGIGNKILVVCNTIKEAQRLYEELSIDIPKDELSILHSRFIKKDRLKKEEEILEFGKTYNDNGEIDIQNGIWISTSIVEASLDIDFDYLFTELQDLNSLFQRLGRCNRKGKKSADKHNCYIYTDINNDNIINGEKGFIDGTLYNLSKEAISDFEGAITEKKKVDLIEKYLTTQNLKDSDYMKDYREIYDYMEKIRPYEFDKDNVKLRNIMSEDIIPSPMYVKYYGEIKELEDELRNPELSVFDRVKKKDSLMKYTVSVYPIDIGNYERAKRQGMAINYNNIILGRDSIKVVECEYGDVGYKKKLFEKKTADSIML